MALAVQRSPDTNQQFRYCRCMPTPVTSFAFKCVGAPAYRVSLGRGSALARSPPIGGLLVTLDRAGCSCRTGLCGQPERRGGAAPQQLDRHAARECLSVHRVLSKPSRSAHSTKTDAEPYTIRRLLSACCCCSSHPNPPLAMCLPSMLIAAVICSFLRGSEVAQPCVQL